MRPAAVAVAVVALATGCAGEDERAVEPPPTPERFEVEAGNVFSGLHAESAAGAVRLTTRRGGERRTVTVRPPAARWRRFWSTVDRLGVWDWKRRYELRPVVPDAESWRVEVARGRRNVVSEGLGTYPNGDGSATRDSEVAFGRFLAAVDRLVGGRLTF